MECVVSQQADRTVLGLVGVPSTGDAERLEAAIRGLERVPRVLTIDLTGAPAIDSSLFGRLIALGSTVMLRGGKVEVKGLPGRLTKLWPGSRQ
jgi:anti-anti-sigma regulatory factor